MNEESMEARKAPGAARTRMAPTSRHITPPRKKTIFMVDASEAKEVGGVKLAA